MANRRYASMKGRFIPKNPQKYVGNINAIFFRSSWERRVMIYFDQNNAVLRWSSEELAIPYINPLKLDARGRPMVSRYYPDFVVMYRDTSGNVKKEIIEVKPFSESVMKPGMSERDKMSYAVNQAKWKAAADYASRNGADFRVITEQSLWHK